MNNNINIYTNYTDRSSKAFDLYLKDVAKIKMLSAEEEKELGYRIQKGDSKAVDMLATSNLRFAITVAKQFQNKGLILQDLISEANLGLIEAAKKFNPDLGFRFLSYAVWYIRRNIMLALNKSNKSIHIPSGKMALVYKINKFKQEFEQKNARNPSIDEISESLDIDIDTIALLNDLMTKEVSLDLSISDESDSTLIDVIENTNSESPDANLAKEDLFIEINSMLSKLGAREAVVLKLLYGINGVKVMTFEEIGTKLGLNKERIRQIYHESINKIRFNNLYEHE